MPRHVRGFMIHRIEEPEEANDQYNKGTGAVTEMRRLENSLFTVWGIRGWDKAVLSSEKPAQTISPNKL